MAESVDYHQKKVGMGMHRYRKEKKVRAGRSVIVIAVILALLVMGITKELTGAGVGNPCQQAREIHEKACILEGKDPAECDKACKFVREVCPEKLEEFAGC